MNAHEDKVLIARLRQMYRAGASVPQLMFEVHRHSGWETFKTICTGACLRQAFGLTIHEAMELVITRRPDSANVLEWEAGLRGKLCIGANLVDEIELHRAEWDSNGSIVGTVN